MWIALSLPLSLPLSVCLSFSLSLSLVAVSWSTTCVQAFAFIPCVLVPHAGSVGLMGLLWDLIKSIIKIYQNQNVKSLSSHVSLWGSHLGHNKFIVLLSPDGTPIAVWYFPQRPSYLQACWAKCFSGQVPPTSRRVPFLVIPMWVISWHSPGLKIGEHFWHLHLSVSGTRSVIRPDICQKYLKYWERLTEDPEKKDWLSKQMRAREMQI